jgi:hypothetical protein
MDATLMDRKERPPFVRFERRAIENIAATREKGYYVASDVDYALITPAYSKDVFIQPVTEWFAQLKLDVQSDRFHPMWLEQFQKMYEAFQRGQEMPVNGTAIRGWNVISPAQQETLLRMNVLTVEDLAAMNDEGIRRIGMGGVDLKHKANAWLAQMGDKGPATLKMAQLEEENARLKADVAGLTEAFDLLKARMDKEQQPNVDRGIAASDVIEEAPKKRARAA